MSVARDVTVRFRGETADLEGKLRTLGFEFETLERESAKTTSNMIRFGKGAGEVVARSIIAWDRFSIAQAAVENAQLRQTIAQDRLNYLLDRYGAGSREAIQAQRELEIATRGVDIAQQRMFVRMAFGIGIIIPEMIRDFKNLASVTRDLGVAKLFTAFATTQLTRAQLALLAATGVGIPLAIGGFLVGQALASQVQNPNVNVYGDVNVQGVPSPADFANELGRQVGVQQFRAARP